MPWVNRHLSWRERADRQAFLPLPGSHWSGGRLCQVAIMLGLHHRESRWKHPSVWAFPFWRINKYYQKVVLLFLEGQEHGLSAVTWLSSSLHSLRVENGAIDPPPPSYSVSGCNLSLTPGLKSEMFPLFVYCSTSCLSRPTSSTLAFRCPRQCNLRIFVWWHS